MMLGPTSADPTMDLTALDIVKTVVVDSPNKLFVGGLPCEWAEDQARRRCTHFLWLAYGCGLDAITTKQITPRAAC